MTAASERILVNGTASARVAGVINRATTLGPDSGFVKLFERRAYGEARLSDQRRLRGEKPRDLEGMLLAWKDIFAIQRHANRAGLDRPCMRPSSIDAELVRRASVAGAINIGATSMTELGYSLLGENVVEGTLRNPGWPGSERRLAGGSSTGSAIAVARGLVPIAFGTDSGGSARLPATWCGQVGFKPSRGTLPMNGCLPFSPSFDTVGILADRIANATAAFNALRVTVPAAAPEPEFVTVDLSALPDVSHDIGQGFQAALDAIGHRYPLERVRLATLETVFAGTLADLIPCAEGAAIWARYRKAPAAASYEFVRNALERDFQRTDGLDLAKAYRQRDELISHFADELSGNVLVLPACPISPPRIEETHSETAYARFYAAASSYLKPFNVLDAPSLCLPLYGHGAARVSVQLVSGHAEEDVLLAAAARLANLPPFKEKR